MKRCYSLKRNKEFRYTYRRGRSVGSKSLVLIYAKARPDDGVKIGFSVSKKLGGAVVRNRIKRRMREAVTPLIPEIKKGFKLIFIARSAAVEEPFISLCADMRYVLKKAKFLADGSTDKS